MYIHIYIYIYVIYIHTSTDPPLIYVCWVPVTSLPGACHPLAFLAVSPGCPVGLPGAWNLFVPSALAHAKNLGGKRKQLSNDMTLT